MTPSSSSTAHLLFPRRETLFEQVSRALSNQIHAGRWKPGELLPNEIELATEFQVAQGTMRRALKLLVDSGLLIRQQGRGTFVAEFRHNEDIVYKRYIRLVPDTPQSEDLVSTSSDLLTFETIPAPEAIRQVLALEPSAEVIHAIRSLKSRGRLVTYDEMWANAAIFHRLTAHNLMHHEEKMLYSFYQSACGVTITRSEETLKAVLMPETLCNALSLTSPIPVMEVRRLAFTFNEQPVEYHRQLSLTDRYHYRVG